MKDIKGTQHCKLDSTTSCTVTVFCNWQEIRPFSPTSSISLSKMLLYHPVFTCQIQCGMRTIEHWSQNTWQIQKFKILYQMDDCRYDWPISKFCTMKKTACVVKCSDKQVLLLKSFHSGMCFKLPHVSLNNLYKFKLQHVKCGHLQLIMYY